MYSETQNEDILHNQTNAGMASWAGIFDPVITAGGDQEEAVSLE